MPILSTDLATKEGFEVPREELIDTFEADEGDIELIYGRIGNGKTTEAVRRMLESLSQGKVVYSNIMLDLETFQFDERIDYRFSFWNLILFRKRFFQFDKSNFHYLDEDSLNTEFLSSLTDCEIYIDEGQWIFDSYEGTKFAKAKRKLILHTRHYNRKIVIITQRPSAIQVSARGNVNRFTKCSKVASWPLLILRTEEFQDMTGEMPDENNCSQHRLHFINSRVFRAFNTHFMRNGVPISQEVNFYAYDLPLSHRFYNFLVLSAKKLRLIS